MRRPADRPPEKQEVAPNKQSPGGSGALHASGDAGTHGTAATSMPADVSTSKELWEKRLAAYHHAPSPSWPGVFREGRIR